MAFLNASRGPARVRGHLPRTGIAIFGHGGAVLLHILLCITFLFHTEFFLYFILYIVPSFILYFIMYYVARATFRRFFGCQENQFRASFGIYLHNGEVLLPFRAQK